jgi:plasmid stabilization system protein ParE
MRSRQHPLVRADIKSALNRSLADFGVHQRQRYRQGIRAALAYLIANPRHGTACPDAPDLLLLPIARRGSRASHRFLYRIEPDGTVFVLRLLHDSMVPAEHIPPH